MVQEVGRGAPLINVPLFPLGEEKQRKEGRGAGHSHCKNEVR